MRATEMAENVQGKSVHRFIAKDESERFWRGGSGLFLGTAIRLTNSGIYPRKFPSPIASSSEAVQSCFLEPQGIHCWIKSFD